jgi:hypothetical protein
MAKLCTSLTVSGVAYLKVTSISCSPSSITIGQSTTITVVVQNTGDLRGAGTLSVTANGSVIATKGTDYIDPGASKTFTFTWTPSSTGTYSVCGEVVEYP